MQKSRNGIFWAILALESSHIFCCILPTVASVMSLLIGVGMISAMPSFMLDIHEFTHQYEVPLIVTSAVVIALGWAFQMMAMRVDCKGLGHDQDGCRAQEKKTMKFLVAATALFVVNLAIYVVFHMNTPELVHID